MPTRNDICAVIKFIESVMFALLNAANVDKQRRRTDCEGVVER